MTVRELIEQLESRDPNMEVYIGMYQKFGSNFVYDIPDIQKRRICNFWGEDTDERYLMFIEGEQVGTIRDDDDDYDW